MGNFFSKSEAPAEPKTEVAIVNRLDDLEALDVDVSSTFKVGTYHIDEKFELSRVVDSIIMTDPDFEPHQEWMHRIVSGTTKEDILNGTVNLIQNKGGWKGAGSGDAQYMHFVLNVKEMKDCEKHEVAVSFVLGTIQHTSEARLSEKVKQEISTNMEDKARAVVADNLKIVASLNG